MRSRSPAVVDHLRVALGAGRAIHAAVVASGRGRVVPTAFDRSERRAWAGQADAHAAGSPSSARIRCLASSTLPESGKACAYPMWGRGRPRLRLRKPGCGWPPCPVCRSPTTSSTPWPTPWSPTTSVSDSPAGPGSRRPLLLHRTRFRRGHDRPDRDEPHPCGHSRDQSHFDSPASEFTGPDGVLALPHTATRTPRTSRRLYGTADAPLSIVNRTAGKALAPME